MAKPEHRAFDFDELYKVVRELGTPYEAGPGAS
jgi:hypothetical protein